MRNSYIQVFLLVLLMSTTSQAKRVELSIGDAAPKWKNLTGIDGKPHSAAQLEKAKAIAVVFTSTECPVANAYVKRLAKLKTDFEKNGLVLVAMNPNKDENLKVMKRHAKEHDIDYLYLHDESQKIAKQFGAKATPEVFLLNQQWKIVYKGAIDDDVKLQGKPKHEYLRDAVEAVLEGKSPKKTTSRPMGCRIRWK